MILHQILSKSMAYNKILIDALKKISELNKWPLTIFLTYHS